MVYYFVIGQDGGRYGPADIDTLVQWTREGRIVATTTLIERGTEREIAAEELTSLSAELGRNSTAEPPVAIERDSVFPRRGAGASPQPQRQPVSGFPPNPHHEIPAARIPTSNGVPPPPPGVHPNRPHNLQYARNPLPVHPITGRPIGSRSRLAAGLLGIFFGCLGVHRFYLGYTGMGLFMLMLSFVSGPITLGYSCGLLSLWGLIEGVVCLCGGMKDADGHELRD